MTAHAHPYPKSKLLQTARRRVLRWSRPPEADLRRQRLQPHPLAAIPPSMTAGKESLGEHHA
jgi:hypothetical protein